MATTGKDGEGGGGYVRGREGGIMEREKNME
jgi:hypothetical protein